jgi:NAD(P)-dependent dehydrogenase (short-subunit alcohol dehydrogenase family)
VPTDVTERDQIQDLIARTIEHFGPLDIIVNNAGIAVFEDPLEVTPENWQRCLSVDLDAVWWASQAALPRMLERGGSSLASVRPVERVLAKLAGV